MQKNETVRDAFEALKGALHGDGYLISDDNDTSFDVTDGQGTALLSVVGQGDVVSLFSKATDHVSSFNNAYKPGDWNVLVDDALHYLSEGTPPEGWDSGDFQAALD